MAGRKKGMEDTIATEERIGTEMQEPDGGGMDLNELLESMDQEPEETGGQENEELPELSEEDMFGKATAETEDDGTGDTGAVPETALEIPAEYRQPEKPKRTSRRKEADGQTTEEQTAEDNMDEDAPIEGESLTDGDLLEETPGDIQEMEICIVAQDFQERQTEDGAVWDSQTETVRGSARQAGAAADHHTPRARKTEVSVLTLESRGEVETESAREDTIWHEIHNAYRTRKILTGQLGGIEQTDSGKTIVIVDYKGFRIVIPLKEMMINLVQGRSPSGKEYTELMLRQNKILGNMLGAEIDFIVKGIDSKTRSVVASRREAMLKKRQIFYLDTDAAGMYRVYEGRIVQARVIAVAEKVIRVEIFGVECSIMARDLSWDWIGDAHERFSVGDQVLVRVLSVRRENLENLGVKADVKSVTQDTHHENLKKCRVQSKYAGKVTDVHKGVVYIRLSNGVNAVAHACYDYRTPGKKDDVSFAVTKIDEERGVAVGIITRIIRQNL